MIVLQSAINKTTFEVLHTALMVTKMQRSLCCAKSSAAYDQSLSLGLKDGATDAAYVTQRCRTAGHGPRHVGLLGRVAVDIYLEVADVLSAWFDIIGADTDLPSRTDVPGRRLAQ